MGDSEDQPAAEVEGSEMPQADLVSAQEEVSVAEQGGDKEFSGEGDGLSPGEGQDAEEKPTTLDDHAEVPKEDEAPSHVEPESAQAEENDSAQGDLAQDASGQAIDADLEKPEESKEEVIGNGSDEENGDGNEPREQSKEEGELEEEEGEDGVAKSSVLLILGPPGSGKSTISQKMAEQYEYHVINMKDLMLRELEEESQAAALSLEATMNVGEIPGSLTHRILRREMKDSGASRILIEGYPNTEEQAEELLNSLPKLKAQPRVFNLLCPTHKLYARLMQKEAEKPTDLGDMEVNGSEDESTVDEEGTDVSSQLMEDIDKSTIDPKHEKLFRNWFLKRSREFNARVDNIIKSLEQKCSVIDVDASRTIERVFDQVAVRVDSTYAPRVPGSASRSVTPIETPGENSSRFESGVPTPIKKEHETPEAEEKKEQAGASPGMVGPISEDEPAPVVFDTAERPPETQEEEESRLDTTVPELATTISSEMPELDPEGQPTKTPALKTSNAYAATAGITDGLVPDVVHQAMNERERTKSAVTKKVVKGMVPELMTEAMDEANRPEPTDSRPGTRFLQKRSTGRLVATELLPFVLQDAMNDAIQTGDEGDATKTEHVEQSDPVSSQSAASSRLVTPLEMKRIANVVSVGVVQIAANHVRAETDEEPVERTPSSWEEYIPVVTGKPISVEPEGFQESLHKPKDTLKGEGVLKPVPPAMDSARSVRPSPRSARVMGQEVTLPEYEHVEVEMGPMQDIPNGKMKVWNTPITLDQENALRKSKVKQRINNEKYLRRHPEISIVCHRFITEVLEQKPKTAEDVKLMAGKWFTQTDLRSHFEELVQKAREADQQKEAERIKQLGTVRLAN